MYSISFLNKVIIIPHNQFCVFLNACVLCIVTHLNLIIEYYMHYYYLHFTNETNEAQIDHVTCLRSFKKVMGLGYKLKLSSEPLW